MEEKYTIQNTLHDVQTSWRDEELSVHKLNCRLTLLTASVCVCGCVACALVRDVSREAHECISEVKPPLMTLYTLQSLLLQFYSDEVRWKREVKAERTCHVFPFILFLFSWEWEAAADAVIVHHWRIRYQMMPFDDETDDEHDATEWVKDPKPQLWL